MFDFEAKLSDFALELFKINAIKFGDYKTKVGLWTPVYCDLRVLVSYPKLLENLADLIICKIKNIKLDTDIICGVPYTALPIATAVSIKTGHPMVMRRKEAKDYGTKKMIEGNFQKGNKCLIIEDVVTSGSSILETVNDLQNAGLEASDVIVLVNREQGGKDILKKNGIAMHALLTITQLMDILKSKDCIDKEMCEKVTKYLCENQTNRECKQNRNRLEMTYSDRINSAKNDITRELFKIMSEKQTNLCVAADMTHGDEILNLAEEVGPHICLLKTHVDIIEDFHPNLIKNLTEIAERHKFMLLEDRKFADIGKTVECQYKNGLFRISSWASFITVHSLMGKGILDMIEKSAERSGVFLLVQSSTAGLIDDKYTKASIEIGQDYPGIITGFVCQSPLFLENPGYIQLTPGVQLNSRIDDLDQQYNSPETVVLERGADIAVVGRGIAKAENPAVAAEEYKNLLWEAYKKRTT